MTTPADLTIIAVATAATADAAVGMRSDYVAIPGRSRGACITQNQWLLDRPRAAFIRHRRTFL